MNYRELISGEAKGFGATITRAGLTVLESIYAPIMSVRNFWYDIVPSASKHVDIPVISIGNLTMGGTGKTPLVALLAQKAIEQDIRTAIVSRGYHAKPGELNDEGKELVTRVPQCIYVQNSHRAVAAQALASQEESTRPGLILLDDGFQHRRLARNLDIVLLDALNPFGYGHVCPRGFLRESICGLKRAQSVIITRADRVEESELESIKRIALRYNPNLVIATACHRPSALRTLSGQTIPLDTLKGKPVLTFCGLGNPAGFQQTVKSVGCDIVKFKAFPDHHLYTISDEKEIITSAQQSHVDAIICTMKDYVKLSDKLTQSVIPVYGLEISMEFLTGQTEFWNLIESQWKNCNHKNNSIN